MFDPCRLSATQVLAIRRGEAASGRWLPPGLASISTFHHPHVARILETEDFHSIDLHDRANGIARQQVGKALVNISKFDPLGNQIIQH